MPELTPAALRAARMLESMEGLDPASDAIGRFIDRVLAPRPALADALHGAPIGHALHPLLTDLPIGLWTGATVLDVLGGKGARGAADRLLGLGVLAAVPTVVAGWADWSVSDRPVRRVGVVHAALSAAGVVLQGTSWVQRRRDHRAAGIALSMAANALVTAGGYLGGHMTLELGPPTGGPVATPARR